MPNKHHLALRHCVSRKRFDGERLCSWGRALGPNFNHLWTKLPSGVSSVPSCLSTGHKLPILSLHWHRDVIVAVLKSNCNSDKKKEAWKHIVKMITTIIFNTCGKWTCRTMMIMKLYRMMSWTWVYICPPKEGCSFLVSSNRRSHMLQGKLCARTRCL
jgi:hypothetical protein